MDNRINTLIQNPELDAFSYHEMMDRAHIVMGQIQELLIDHPVAECHPELRERLEKAQSEIWEIYQIAGSVKLIEEESE
jgi:hypothetical protein